MRTILALVTALLAGGLACGGSQKGGETKHQAEHGPLPPAVNAFHELLAPLWHADPGDKRAEDTCAAIEDLRQRAADIVVAETPPAATADEAGYRDAASALVHAVVELGDACGADRSAFADRLTDVHTAFHVVMEKAGGAAH